jgi:hypothetical protein
MFTLRSIHTHAFLIGISALSAAAGNVYAAEDNFVEAVRTDVPEERFHPFDAAVCLTDAADSAPMHTAKSPEGYLFDSRLSNDTAYNQTSCAWYIADLVALSSYSGPYNSHNFTFGGGFQNWSQIDEASCAKATVDYAVHKRTYSVLTGKYSAWTTVHTGTYQAWWDNDPDAHPHACRSNVFFTYQAPSTIYSTDTYRMTVLPKLNGVVQPARIDWEWAY